MLSPPVWRPHRPSLVSASGRDHIAHDLAGNRADFQSPSGDVRSSAASSWHRGMSASREERLSSPVWRPHRPSLVSASGRDHIEQVLAGNRTNIQSPPGAARASAASFGHRGTRASWEERLSQPVWRPHRQSLVSASGRGHIAQNLAGNRATFQSPSGVDRTPHTPAWRRGLSDSPQERRIHVQSSDSRRTRDRSREEHLDGRTSNAVGPGLPAPSRGLAPWSRGLSVSPQAWRHPLQAPPVQAPQAHSLEACDPVAWTSSGDLTAI